MLPKQVVINECWARDGLQNQDLFIDTELKLQMLNKLVDTGFTRIEATSFSHPKFVPQFIDALEVIHNLPSAPSVIFKSTCVNRKALIRAIDAKKAGARVDEVSFVMAASDAYNQINVKMNNNQLLEVIIENIHLANSANIENILVSISTAFGCSIQGKVDQEEIFKLVEKLEAEGIKRFTISDTTGVGNPLQSKVIFTELLSRFPNCLFIAHFHDTKGWGIANNFAALEAGITHFDTSLGGIGGPPAQRVGKNSGNTGNVCTEDFVLMLHSMGIETGIDENKLIEAGKFSEEILGRQYSKTLITY